MVLEIPPKDEDGEVGEEVDKEGSAGSEHGGIIMDIDKIKNENLGT